LQIVYPPELEFDTSRTYSGRANQQVKWAHFNNEISGYIDFTKIYQPSGSGVVYAARTIQMEKDTDVKIGIGSNDGVRMWVNSKLVLDHKIARKAEPNQEIITVHFKKGENMILLKIDQLGGGWGFYYTIL